MRKRQWRKNIKSKIATCGLKPAFYIIFYKRTMLRAACHRIQKQMKQSPTWPVMWSRRVEFKTGEDV